MTKRNDPFGFEAAINWNVVNNLSPEQVKAVLALFDKDKEGQDSERINLSPDRATELHNRNG